MRQIEFRGKRLDNGKWAYGKGVVLLEEHDLAMIIEQVKGNLSQHTGVDPETVGQYTGFKAKKDAKIWEGDLLSNNHKTDKEVVREVKFEKGKWVLVRIKGNSTLPKVVSLHDFYRLNYEVIGNIHK